MLSESLINTVQELSVHLDDGMLSVPPPSESFISWPVIGESLTDGKVHELNILDRLIAEICAN
jgi:hypothetical protein